MPGEEVALNHLSAPLQPNLNVNHAVEEEVGNHSCGIIARDNTLERGLRDTESKPRSPKSRPEHEGCS